MAKRLWDFFDDEPFLINPHVAVVNPRKRKSNSRGKKKVMARTTRRRRSPVRRRRTSAAAPRRRRKRNSWVSAGPVANPRRRRRRRSASSPIRRRTTYRRNPAIMGVQLPDLQTILFAGAGFVATPMVEGFVHQFVPAEWSSIGKYAIRIGSVLGLTWLTKQVVGSAQAKAVAIGGSVYVATSAVAEFMPDLVPGVGAYTPALGAYSQSHIAPLPSMTGTGDANNRFQRFGN